MNPECMQRTARSTVVLCLALVGLALFAASASAQSPTTLTVRVAVIPATDAGRFDLAIDGVPLATGVGDGGSTGTTSVLAGSFAVSEVAAAGTSLPLYSTSITCVDGGAVLIDAAPQTTATVAVAEGHDVVCTFTNTLLPVVPNDPPAPVVAPPITAKPILLPPAFVRGTAILRGIEGCTARSVVTTRVIGRNISRIVFIRDGHVVKRVKAPSLTWRSYTVDTVLPRDDLRLHTVLVRAYFITGATPRVKSMMHRFAHCRASAVVG